MDPRRAAGRFVVAFERVGNQAPFLDDSGFVPDKTFDCLDEGRIQVLDRNYGTQGHPPRRAYTRSSPSQQPQATSWRSASWLEVQPEAVFGIRWHSLRCSQNGSATTDDGVSIG